MKTDFININKSKNSYEIVKELVNSIKIVVDNHIFDTNFATQISKSTKIPKETIEQKLYQILFKKFDFKKNALIKIGFKNLITDFIKIFFLTLLSLVSIFFLKGSKKNKINYEILGDKAENQLSLNRYTMLIKNAKSSCIICNFKPNKKIKNERYFFINKMSLPFCNLSYSEKIIFFFLNFKILFFSIRKNINFTSIYYELIYDIYKSAYIFSFIKAKYYINYKYYDTSPIFNYFFKKNGGKIVACTQKNICLLSLSCFVYSDIMFTLGKAQGKICNKLGGKINKFIPVGSLFMEDAWHRRKKDLKNIPYIDIFIVGQNTVNNNRHYINNSYEKCYYSHYLNWLKKISNDFPLKKIVLKHHAIYEDDPREIAVLKKLISGNKNKDLKAIIK